MSNFSHYLSILNKNLQPTVMRILLSSIYPYVFLLLYLTIPFDNYMRALPNILLVVLAVSFPFVVTKADFQKLKRLPTLLFIVFVLFLFILALITGRLAVDSPVIEKVALAMGLVHHVFIDKNYHWRLSGHRIRIFKFWQFNRGDARRQNLPWPVVCAQYHSFV